MRIFLLILFCCTALAQDVVPNRRLNLSASTPCTIILDDMESYTAGAAVNGLNGAASCWGGAYVTKGF